MTRLLVVHGPGADPARGGLAERPPGRPAALDERCRAWGRPLAVEVATAWTPDVDGLDMEVRRGSQAADALVLVPGEEAVGSTALGLTVSATGLPTVELHLVDIRRAGHDPHGSSLAAAGARVIHGRGIDGYRWAIHHLARREANPPAVVAYGDGPDRVGDLRVPPSAGPHPVATLVHGGFWFDPWERDLMDGLAVDLSDRGWATWNVEYRRVGSGGGWPDTATDVAAAVDHLASLAGAHRLDLDEVVLVGHSAGAQLAMVTAARGGAAVRPRLLVSLAGVLDLAAAHADRLGGGAVEALLSGPPDARTLGTASPVARVPLRVPAIVTHAGDDPLVPAGQSRAYAAAADAAGDTVTLLEHPGDDHFGLVDPSSPGWRAVADRISAHVGAAQP